MKKMNFSFLSACSFLLVLGVFLVSSCTSIDSNEELVAQEELVLEKGYLLPLGISNLATDQLESHLSEMSAELEMTYTNNSIVGQYLDYFGKANDLGHSLSDDDNLSQIDMSKILTEAELIEMNASLLTSLPEVQTRGCSTIYRWDNCCYPDHNGNCVATWCPHGCWPPHCC